MNRFVIGLCGVTLLLSAGRPLSQKASADVFVLSSGGRIEGELLNPEEKPRKTYVVKLASGGKLSLDASQVTGFQQKTPQIIEFEKARSQYPDTAEGQLKLAQWCRDHGLATQRKAVLRHIIDDLDSNNADARRILEYVKRDDGNWYTRDEWMRHEGRVLYKGEWLMRQEVEIAEGRRKKDLAEKEWFAKIDRFHNWLLKEKTSKQGRDGLLSITDPLAVRALDTKIKTEQSQEVKLLYVEALGKIDTAESRGTLAIHAINDEMEEVRLSCVDELEKSAKKAKDPLVSKFLIGRLTPKSENKVLTRAAVALSRLKDPDSILPLINVLTVLRKQQVSGGGGPGSMTTTFDKTGKSGGGGLAMNQKPQYVYFDVHNQAVLDALVAITQQNFNYDKRAWTTWYNSQKNKAQPVDARRG